MWKEEVVGFLRPLLLSQRAVLKLGLRMFTANKLLLPG
jgi:hypothetical protein